MPDRATFQRVLAAHLLGLLLAAPAVAQEAAEDVAAPAPAEDVAEDVVPLDASEILRRALANRFELDARATIEVTIVSRTGGTESRRADLVSKWKDGQILSFGRFSYPEDMRDMAVLRLEHADRNDDFWAYLPEFRRVRRLSAAQKNDLFLGTDAAFEDVERRRLGDYQVALLPSSEFEGEEIWTVSARPTYESGYDRVEYQVAKSDFSILRTRHFKKGDDQPFKIIETPRETTEEHGGHTIPMRAVVRDIERGTSTELEILRILVNPVIDDKIFTLGSLTNERPIPRFESMQVRED